MKAIRILTLITGLFSGVATLAADSAQATPAVSLTGEKAVAQLKETGQYDSIAAAYEAARHAVRADEAEPDGVLHAQNPGHGLSASFDRHGLHLSVQRQGSEGERLTTRWRLDSVGRDGAVEKVPAGDALRRDGQRAEIVRAGLGLTEWFVNRPSGLEHGFTLDRRPAGEGALRLDIAIEGDLSPVPGADGQRIELHDAAGAKVLDYDKLRVWDATGRELPARMERSTAGGLRFLVEDAGARYPLTVDPTFTQQAYLKASNAGAGDNFGLSVAVSGDTVVVGASNEDSSTTSINSTPNESATDAGAAYVFVRSGSTWTQQAYLKASNAGTNDIFGFSVAISGDTVVVGALREASSTTGINTTPNESAPNAGAAYVFVRSGSTWTQQAYIKASNAGAGDQFGVSVAISGDSVVVGANIEDSSTTGINTTPNESAPNAGAAYVFVRSGSTWTQQAYLKGSNAGADDRFGARVAISGDTVVVGALGEASSTTGINSTPNESATDAGAAYVFVRSGSTWTQQAYLKGSNAGAGDNFGLSVAVSGDTVVVGAINEDSSTTSINSTPNESATDAGAAYVFVRSGSTWTQQAYLKASNAGTNDIFGISVAISGDTVVVGAVGEASSTTSINSTPDESAPAAGAAYVFVRSGSTWTQQAYLKASNAGASDVFGISVAIFGDSVVVGAQNEDSGTTAINSTPNESATDAGAVYVFTLIPDPTLTSVSPPTGTTAGGTTVTLTGTNFTGATGVTFGGTAATIVGVTATTITCTTPARSAGPVNVLVTTPGGTSVASAQFTYAPAAASGSWNVTAGGTASWATASNWTPVVVPGTTAGDVVNFTNNIAGAYTVPLDGTRTVGDLNIGDSTAPLFGFTLSAGTGGILSLDGVGTNDATVDFTASTANSISAPIALVDNAVFRSNVTNLMTLSGIISGAGRSVTYNNDTNGSTNAAANSQGNFIVSGVNTYSGGTTISDVRVIVETTGSAFGTGAVTIASGGQFYSGFATSLTFNNSFTIAGDGWVEGSPGAPYGALRVEGDSTVSGNVVLSAAAAVGNFSASGTISGIISGGFALSKRGAGTMVLSGANTFSGGLTVTQGTVQLGSTTALGSGAASVVSLATLNLGGQTVTNAVTMATGSSLIGTGGLNAAANTVAGDISPGVGTGLGTVTFSNASATTLSGTCAMQIGGNNTSDVISKAVGPLNLTGTVTVTFVGGYVGVAGHTFDLFNAGGTMNISAIPSLPSLPAGLVWNSATFATTGQLSIVSAAASGSWNVTAGGTASWNSASNWTPVVVPGTTAGDVVNFTNNIAADYTVPLDGTRTVGDLNIGDSTAPLFGFTLSAGTGGILSLDGVGTTAATVDFTASTANSISAPIALADNAVFRSNVANPMTLSGIISGAGRSVTYNNDTNGSTNAAASLQGQFLVSGVNTYSGGTTISDVRVAVETTGSALGTGNVTIASGGQFYSGFATSLTFNNSFTIAGDGWVESSPGAPFGALRVEGNSTVSGNVVLSAAAAVGNFTGTTGTISGIISGGFALSKRGPGTMVLSGANTFSGGLTVTSGTVQLGSTTALGSGAASVSSGATLNLGGQTVTNAVTMATGSSLIGTGGLNAAANTVAGDISPGVGTGLGTVTFSNASATTLSGTCAMQIGGNNTSDVISKAVGPLNLTGTVTVTFVGGYVGVAGHTFDLFNAGGAMSISAIPSLPSLPAGLVWNSATFATTGQLSIASGISFAQWAASVLGNPSATPTGDHDRDGLANGVEYALGLFPAQPGTVVPVIDLFTYGNGRSLRVRFTRPLDRTGVTLRVQASSDLLTWTDLAVSVNSAPFTGPGFVSENRNHPLADPGAVEVRDTLTTPANPRRMVRLHVDIAP